MIIPIGSSILFCDSIGHVIILLHSDWSLLYTDAIETHVERAANDVGVGRGQLGMAVRYKVY